MRKEDEVMDSAAQVLAQVDSIQDWLEELYVHLHQNPELSMQETQTSALMASKLKELGFVVQTVGGGVVGVLENGAGPTVMFRADMDGLPVREETGLPYASVSTQVDRYGVEQPTMHACGHDFHMSAALGAARLLAAHKDAWSGTYIALFQPAEETYGGAQSMVDAGLAQLIPHPDVALAQHVFGAPFAGQVATNSGPSMSATTSIKVTLFGRGSHGSMPHLSVDPVVMAAAVVLRLQGIVARELKPGTFGVVTVGSIHGGTQGNIIPETVTLRLNIRAYDMQVRQSLLEAIERIVVSEAKASGAPKEPEFEIYDPFPVTDNDASVTEKVTEAFVNHFGPERVKHWEPITASEDFSIIPRALGTPYCYWSFGGFAPDTEAPGNHSPKFGPLMQPTLRTGTEAALSAVLAFLGK
ncbi:MAG: amidohydrolase [Actinomycetaceae bacterium]|nr:amidohydrolase [Actinomycetaceae bacterium]